MVDINKLSEGLDYDLVPVVTEDNQQGWDVRIITGDYVETVVRFGNISFDHTTECLNFNFDIIYTPNDNITLEDFTLQEYCGKILEDILENSLATGTAVLEEKE